MSGSDATRSTLKPAGTWSDFKDFLGDMPRHATCNPRTRTNAPSAEHAAQYVFVRRFDTSTIIPSIYTAGAWKFIVDCRCKPINPARKKKNSGRIQRDVAQFAGVSPTIPEVTIPPNKHPSVVL